MFRTQHWKIRLTVVNGQGINHENWVIETPETLLADDKHVWKYKAEEDIENYWQEFCSQLAIETWDYPYQTFLRDMIKAGNLEYIP